MHVLKKWGKMGSMMDMAVGVTVGGVAIGQANAIGGTEGKLLSTGSAAVMLNAMSKKMK